MNKHLQLVEKVDKYLDRGLAGSVSQACKELKISSGQYYYAKRRTKKAKRAPLALVPHTVELPGTDAAFAHSEAAPKMAMVIFGDPASVVETVTRLMRGRQ